MKRSPITMSVYRLVILTAIALTPGAASAECMPHVEESPQWRSAQLRRHTDAFERCMLSEERYRRVVADWLDQRGADAGPVRSLFLGRAIHLPWVRDYMVTQAPARAGWREASTPGNARKLNPFVAALLSEAQMLARLDAPFAGSRLRVAGVSVEKVLVDRAHAAHGGNPQSLPSYPHDAQVWLVLETRG